MAAIILLPFFTAPPQNGLTLTDEFPSRINSPIVYPCLGLAVHQGGNTFCLVLPPSTVTSLKFGCNLPDVSYVLLGYLVVSKVELHRTPLPEPCLTFLTGQDPLLCEVT